MIQRRFGTTGMTVSPIALGTMEWGALTDDQAARLVDTALDGGLNVLDTAPCYPGSEPRVGAAIRGRRDRLLLFTKCGCTGDYHDHPHRFDRATLLRNIDESLLRLGTDHIDLWQLHMQSSSDFPDGPDGEVARTMRKIQETGKVRHIGLSFKNSGPDDPLYPAEHGFLSAQRFGRIPGFDAVQLVYGALTRTSEQAVRGLAGTGKAVIARGLLKQYDDTYPELLRRLSLEELCGSGETVPQLLIRFALGTAGLTLGLVGTTNPAHLTADLTAADRGPLEPGVRAEMLRRLEREGVTPRPFSFAD